MVLAILAALTGRSLDPNGSEMRRECPRDAGHRAMPLYQATGADVDRTRERAFHLAAVVERSGERSGEAVIADSGVTGDQKPPRRSARKLLPGPLQGQRESRGESAITCPRCRRLKLQRVCADPQLTAQL